MDEEKSEIERVLIEQVKQGVMEILAAEYPVEIGMGRIDAALQIANNLKLGKKDLIVEFTFAELIKYRTDFYENTNQKDVKVDID